MSTFRRECRAARRRAGNDGDRTRRVRRCDDIELRRALAPDVRRRHRHRCCVLKLADEGDRRHVTQSQPVELNPRATAGRASGKRQVLELRRAGVHQPRHVRHSRGGLDAHPAGKKARVRIARRRARRADRDLGRTDRQDTERLARNVFRRAEVHPIEGHQRESRAIDDDGVLSGRRRRIRSDRGDRRRRQRSRTRSTPERIRSRSSSRRRLAAQRRRGQPRTAGSDRSALCPAVVVTTTSTWQTVACWNPLPLAHAVADDKGGTTALTTPARTTVKLTAGTPPKVTRSTLPGANPLP